MEKHYHCYVCDEMILVGHSGYYEGHQYCIDHFPPLKIKKFKGLKECQVKLDQILLKIAFIQEQIKEDPNLICCKMIENRVLPKNEEENIGGFIENIVQTIQKAKKISV